ncbi:MAG: histidine--tRNA ligase [Pseudomonadota bacterium]
MFKSLKGMPDILPPETDRWNAMEDRLRRLLTLHGYDEIRTPFLEKADLFARSIGSTTDVVEKEMYTFTDRDGELISLRPEGTASVVRAYIESHLEHGNDVLKLYYLGPMFRHERPQKGRFRQFSQMGVELIGDPAPSSDAEVLALGMALMHEFDVPQASLELNSVGDQNCRPAYRARLTEFLHKHEQELCENCRRRIDVNPMRVLDCKSEGCSAAVAKAPKMLDHLCAACKEHFEKVQNLLSHAGVAATVNPRIVRGLDYYTRTAFEVVGGGLGSQNAVLAGGRYDGLCEELGGRPTPGIGFAMGLERLLLSGRNIEARKPPRIEVIGLTPEAGPETLRQAVRIREELAHARIHAAVDLAPGSQSLKSALRRANKDGAAFAVLIGSDELAKNRATVKNLAQHAQTDVPFEELARHFAGLLK